MGFINIKVLMDRIMRHPLMKDIPMETVVDYAIDFIRIVGTPPSFFEKTALIKIEDYRGQLPCDFYFMQQVRDDKGNFFRYSSDTFHMSPYNPKKSSGAMVVIDTKCGKEPDGADKLQVIVDPDIPSGMGNPFPGLTYKLQGDCIFTSIEKGTIEVSYLALPMDDEGYPLIPDNSAYIRAIEAYVKMQWFTILFDLGKIVPQVLQNAQQQYAWAVGQASVDMILPSIDQMEMISNMWGKLLPNTTMDHQHGYMHEGTKEQFNIH